MENCPSCGSESITNIQRIQILMLSSSRCKQCGSKVTIEKKKINIINGIMVGIAGIAIAYSIFSKSWIPLIVFSIIWIVLDVILVHYAKLKISKESRGQST